MSKSHRPCQLILSWPAIHEKDIITNALGVFYHNCYPIKCCIWIEDTFCINILTNHFNYDTGFKDDRNQWKYVPNVEINKIGEELTPLYFHQKFIFSQSCIWSYSLLLTWCLLGQNDPLGRFNNSVTRSISILTCRLTSIVWDSHETNLYHWNLRTWKTQFTSKMDPGTDVTNWVEWEVIRLSSITPVLSYGVYTVSGRDPVIVTR